MATPGVGPGQQNHPLNCLDEDRTISIHTIGFSENIGDEVGLMSVMEGRDRKLELV